MNTHPNGLNAAVEQIRNLRGATVDEVQAWADDIETEQRGRPAGPTCARCGLPIRPTVWSGWYHIDTPVTVHRAILDPTPLPAPR